MSAIEHTLPNRDISSITSIFHNQESPKSSFYELYQESTFGNQHHSLLANISDGINYSSLLK
jgi:hypothetical protein